MKKFLILSLAFVCLALAGLAFATDYTMTQTNTDNGLINANKPLTYTYTNIKGSNNTASTPDIPASLRDFTVAVSAVGDLTSGFNIYAKVPGGDGNWVNISSLFVNATAETGKKMLAKATGINVKAIRVAPAGTAGAVGNATSWNATITAS